MSVRVTEVAGVKVEVRRGDRVVRRTSSQQLQPNRTTFLRLAPKNLPRGRYSLRVVAEKTGRSSSATINVRRL